MNADAYAGFLRLLLTPATRVPKVTPELEAYFHYLNEREPVTVLESQPVITPKQAA
jgi:hypothetical protein